MSFPRGRRRHELQQEDAVDGEAHQPVKPQQAHGGAQPPDPVADGETERTPYGADDSGWLALGQLNNVLTVGVHLEVPTTDVRLSLRQMTVIGGKFVVGIADRAQEGTLE